MNPGAPGGRTIRILSPLQLPASQGRDLVRSLASSRLAIALALPALFLVHVFFRHPDYSLLNGVLAGLAAMVTAIVLVRYFGCRRPTRQLPIFEWAFVQYYLFWTLPIFFPGASTPAEPFERLRQSGAVTSAFLAVLVFFAALPLGAKAAKLVKFPRRLQQNAPAIATPLLLLYAAITLVATWKVWLGQAEEVWYFFLVRVVAAPSLAQVLMIYELEKHPKRTVLRTAYWVFVVAQMAIGILDSRLHYALLPLIIVVLARITQNRTVPLKFGVLIVVFLLLFNSAKLIYRQMVGFRSDVYTTVSFQEKLQAWEAALASVWQDSGGGGDDDPLSSAARRFDDISTIATTFVRVPEFVDYQMGASWAPLVYTLVPRAIWRDKPADTAKDDFNISLRLQTPASVRWSTGRFPIIAEGYYNFGWIGIVFTGVLAGLFLGLVKTVFSPWNRERFAIALLILAYLQAMMNVTRFIGGNLQIALASIVVIKLLECLSVIGSGAARPARDAAAS